MVFEPGEADGRELHSRDAFLRGRRQRAVFGQRHQDVLEHGHRSEQRTTLERHAERPEQLPARSVVCRSEVDAVDTHDAVHRWQQTDEDLHQRALAAAGAAEDPEHLAATHRERDVGQDAAVAVAGGETFDLDDGVGLCAVALSFRCGHRQIPRW
jgi:hypothetical protein